MRFTRDNCGFTDGLDRGGGLSGGGFLTELVLARSGGLVVGRDCACPCSRAGVVGRAPSLGKRHQNLVLRGGLAGAAAPRALPEQLERVVVGRVAGEARVRREGRSDAAPREGQLRRRHFQTRTFVSRRGKHGI